MEPFNMQKFQPPYVQYDSGFQQMGPMPPPQASVNYSAPPMSPYCPMGLSRNSGDALYMQWPTQFMMYAQSYDQLRHAAFQVGSGFSFLTHFFLVAHN